MRKRVAFQRLSEIQDEVLRFTWEQVGDKVDKFYVQGKVKGDDRGNITSYEGNLNYAAKEGRILNNSEVISRDDFSAGSDFILPRIVGLHDILVGLQGKSPVRFRWAVDTKTGEEKEDDFWWSWRGDFAWRDQFEVELREQQSRG